MGNTGQSYDDGSRGSVVQGTKEPVYDALAGLRLPKGSVFPVMIKASSGGGGKGMRIAQDADSFGKKHTAQMNPSMPLGRYDVY